MSNIPSLEAFDCDGDVSSVGLRWRKWIRALEIYLEAASITDPKKKRANLLHLGGLGIQEIFYNLPGANVTDTDCEDGDSYTIAIEKLDQYFSPKQSRIYERHQFRLLKQETGEKFEKFLVRLRNQAEKCQFMNVEEQIIDQITEKCLSVELKKKILATGDSITLEKIIAEAISSETVDRQISEFTEKPGCSSATTVNLLRQKNILSTAKCMRCGSGIEKGQVHDCPAVNKVCRKCNFRGHYEKCCRSKKINKNQRGPPPKKFKQRQPRNEEVDYVENQEDVEYVFHIDDDDVVDCKVGGIVIKMLIDSGCKSNIINDYTWRSLKKCGIVVQNQIKKPNKVFFGYGSKDPLEILGSFEAIIEIGPQKEVASFYVIKDGKRNLLGKQTAISLGVLKIGLNINNLNSEIFPKFKDVLIHIPIDKTVKPVSQPYRRIPIPLEQKINLKLEELMQADIIEEVKGPSEWVSPMVPVLKENGDVRICIDMRKANTAILRENYPLPTMNSLLPNFRKAKYFSRLDIKNAFHQIEISPRSRYITTFISSKGLFRYKRLMFGITSAPEIFQKTLEKMLLPCQGTVNFIDDILIYGTSEEEHDHRVRNTLNILRENHVLLNKSKCIFKITEVRFLGHRLSPEGVRPLEDYVSVIQSFRAPKTIEEVHSFLGLVNFVGKWIPNLATLTDSLRKLLRMKLSKHANIIKYWGEDQNNNFKKLKESLSHIKTLGYYDPSDRTQVVADASPVGLGAVLIQFDKEGPRIIAYGNKSLTDCEKRYCQTEKEALALVWAVEHFGIYLYGKDEFELVTDHKPLEVIFSPRSRPCARIERWVLRLQSFNFKIIYKPGKTNIADPLSRLCQTNPSTSFEAYDQVSQIVELARPVAVTMQEIQESSQTDEEILELKDGIQNNNWSESVKRCQIFQEEFCLCGDILLRGTRIVIPKNLRQRVLDAAHEGHPGIVAMKGRLRTKVWWPKIDEHAEKIVKTCKGCLLVSTPTIPQPMKRRQLPTGPWIDVAMDFMGPLPTGEHLFVIVDYFSRYKEIKIMRSITSMSTINILKDIFSRLGFPMTITCDNGKQFISEEIKTYFEENGIKIFNSIPYWPQMNGEVERQNRDILKRLKISQALKKNWRQELVDYQMMYNSTPHSTTGKTPSELFFRRQFRDKIPSSGDTENSIFEEHAREKDQTQKQIGKEYGDRKRRAGETDLELGDKVYKKILIRENKTMPEFDPSTHTVVDKTGGDVVIRNDDSGQECRRNIVHLKKIEGKWSVCDDSNC